MPAEFVEIFVEELSCEVALRNLLPNILPNGVEFDIRTFQGKQDLLQSLPTRLRARARYLGPHERLLVLVDRDDDDCLDLKHRLEVIATTAALRTKAIARAGTTIQVMNRIAVEELEAWFFGDVPAICTAFPGVPATLAARAPFRDPDAIAGGTAERFERVLQNAGYYRGGLAKVDAARRVSAEMDSAANRSQSFNCFRRGVLELVS